MRSSLLAGPAAYKCHHGNRKFNMTVSDPCILHKNDCRHTDKKHISHTLLNAWIYTHAGYVCVATITHTQRQHLQTATLSSVVQDVMEQVWIFQKTSSRVTVSYCTPAEQSELWQSAPHMSALSPQKNDKIIFFQTFCLFCLLISAWIFRFGVDSIETIYWSFGKCSCTCHEIQIKTSDPGSWNGFHSYLILFVPLFSI